MDASEEKDVALQRSSSHLLSQFKSSLPKFLWHRHLSGSSTASHTELVKSIARLSTLEHLTKLLESFQEWPQLLDPELNAILMPLVSAFTATLSGPLEKYCSCPTRLVPNTIPLPRAVCKLLYTFCKVRGSKVISQFFSNEPMYIDLMLNALQNRSQPAVSGSDSPRACRSNITWEEKYIMLLWLSHLFLTPFDLVSVSSVSPRDRDSLPLFLTLPRNTPPVVKRSLTLAFQHIEAAGKEREAAVSLLVRLILRPDMIRLGLLNTLVGWAVTSLEEINNDSSTSSTYNYIGVLSFLASTVTSVEIVSIAPFLMSIFQCIRKINAEKAPTSKFILSSAVARKGVVKVLRSITVVALQLDLTHSFEMPSLVEFILEDVIQHLLTALTDTDTPVRLAASKALSVVTLNLQPSMANEITEAIIGAMEEKVLWVKSNIHGSNIPSIEPDLKHDFKQRNLTAVSSVRWQGLVLTLSHLLFRRCPSAKQLPMVLNALIMALGFEQRTSSGKSSGASVRDAACFGIWSLARRYTTNELLAVDTTTLRTSRKLHPLDSMIQIVADELVISATTDPSGNIRRGASAALQELIGRHPDNIIDGIGLVQVIDYHAIALRSTALQEIVINTAKLDIHYWAVALDALLSWRAVVSSDAISRRYTARAIGRLSILSGSHGFGLTISRLWANLRGLGSRDVEGRHGLLLAASAVILRGSEFLLDDELVPLLILEKLWNTFQSDTTVGDQELTSHILRPTLTAEGACMLILSLASVSSSQMLSKVQQPSLATIMRCVHIINLSLTHTEDIVIRSASDAINVLILMMEESQRQNLVRQWTARLDLKLSGSSHDNIIGILAVLGSVYERCRDDRTLQQKILKSILSLLKRENDIDIKVGCLKSLSTGIIPCEVFDRHIASVTLNCMQDYTIDERGDVGSLVRFEAIVTVHTAYKCDVLNNSSQKENIIARVCCLAAEKLDKIRFRAWQCLQEVWGITGEAQLGLTFSDISQVSSTLYYSELMSLFSVQWVRTPLLEGMVTSAGVGSESILCASRAAMVTAIESSPHEYFVTFWECLLDLLKRNMGLERLAVPLLEVLGFILSIDVWDNTHDNGPSFHKAFALVQQCHYKSGNTRKLKAALDIYVGLSRSPPIKSEVLLKVASMLLHPSSTIRNKAADALYMTIEFPGLSNVDWSRPPGELKVEVHRIRDYLKSTQST